MVGVRFTDKINKGLVSKETVGGGGGGAVV